MSVQCSGKKACSYAQAQREAKLLRRAKGAKAQAYHCGDCGQWHVGNQIGGPHLANRLRRQKLDRILEREAWT